MAHGRLPRFGMKIARREANVAARGKAPTGREQLDARWLGGIRARQENAAVVEAASVGTARDTHKGKVPDPPLRQRQWSNPQVLWRRNVWSSSGTRL
jgi:hypothetical protein